MKQFQLILTFVFIVSLSFAQEINFELKSTELYKDKITKRNYGFECIGKNNSYFYYLNLPFRYTFGYGSVGSNEIPDILMYDHNLNLIKKQELILETENKERDYKGTALINDKIYILSSFQNTEHKKHYLFVHSMNSETLETNNDLKKIGEIDYSGINKYFNTYFNMEFSADKSKILIYYNIINKENVNLRYGMYVFDNSFNLKWKHENLIPKMTYEGSFIYKQFKIDNSGNIYIRGLITDNKKEEEIYMPFSGRISGSNLTYFSKYPAFKHMIMYFSNNGTKQEEVIITLPGKSIHNMTIIPSETESVLCTGSYSEQNLITAKGLFSFKYNLETKKYGTVYSKELERKLEDTGLEEKFIEDFNKEVKNTSEWDPFEYICDDLKKQSNGEYVCVAEQFLEGVRVTSSGNVTTRAPIYIYNDIFHYTISASGAIKEINQVHKRQYTDDSNIFSSYFFGFTGDKQYFLFMDIIRNETFTKIAKPSNLYLIIIDKNLKQKKQIIYTPDVNNSNETYLLPNSGMLLSDNEVVFATTALRFKNYAIKKLLIK